MIRTGAVRAIVSRERDFRLMAEGAGCEVTTVVDFDIEGQPAVSVTIACPDNEVAVVLLNLLANYYGQSDPRVLELAAVFRSKGQRQADYPDYVCRAIHRYVSKNVSFRDEASEEFRAPDVTLRLRYGDCDDHAVLTAALAKACSINARVSPIRGPEGDISHVASVLHYRNRDYWCETTLEKFGGAYFGEFPLDAVDRLQIRSRRDIG